MLDAFLAPYRGANPDAWPDEETRLIAINEGRLVDFVTEHDDTYPLLAGTIRAGLGSGADPHGVAVVNLNARDLVADPGAPESRSCTT